MTLLSIKYGGVVELCACDCVSLSTECMENSWPLSCRLARVLCIRAKGKEEEVVVVEEVMVFVTRENRGDPLNTQGKAVWLCGPF